MIKEQHFHGCSNQSQHLKGIPGSAVPFPFLGLIDLMDANFVPALESTCLAVIFFEQVILKCFELDFGPRFSPSNNLLMPLTPSRFPNSKSYLVSTLVDFHKSPNSSIVTQHLLVITHWIWVLQTSLPFLSTSTETAYFLSSLDNQ